ncbi:MAG: NADH-quinone oxidoreductase subunit N [Bacteroidales bacterium]|nr:NADH-quinone oxidoreductase subunit N [Bacteroidales bacterium]
MTKLDFLCLMPFLLNAGAPIIIMIAITISRNFRVVYGISLIMFLAAFLSLFPIMPHAAHNIVPLLVIDSYGILFLGIIYFTSILITILSYNYLRKHGGEREEFFIILFVAVLGASVLVVANQFISFFLGLETLSISLYTLIPYLKSRDYCIEAGIKFLIIASVATAFLLFGMGLIYAETGTMSFSEIAPALGNAGSLSPLMLSGFGLILAGIGFKLALVPFHMWTPDIYQGAPAPVTTFIATISKGAVLALALRFFIDLGSYKNGTLIIILSVISILSMFTGNLLALKQTNIKRLLAYSSIAHLGYLLITLIAGTTAGIEAAIFYLVAYIITTLGAFGIITILSIHERDAENIDDLKGLFWNNPGIAVVLTLALLSLAGIPLTAGFMSKFYLVLAGVRSGLWLLAFSLVINSVISLYYYLRVIKTMFSPTDSGKNIEISAGAKLVMAIIVAGILLLGILPSFLTEFISNFSSIN